MATRNLLGIDIPEIPAYLQQKERQRAQQVSQPAPEPEQPQSGGFGQAIGDVLKGIGYGIVPNTMGAIDALRTQRQGQQFAGQTAGPERYQKLADYWADKDPERAKQYLQLAGVGSDEVYGQTVELDDGNIYQLTRSGQPRLLGKAPPKAPKIQGGFIVDQSSGMPVAEMPLTARERAQEARANAQLQLGQAAASRAAESAALSRQTMMQQQQARETQLGESAQRRRIEVSKAEAPIKKLESQLSQLQKAAKGAGRLDLINPLSQKNAELKSLISQIQLTYKDVAGLGALVGADFTILDGVIQRPETLSAIAGGPERYQSQIQQMRNELKLAKDGVRNLYGERSTFSEQPKASSDYASKYGLTPRGK